MRTARRLLQALVVSVAVATVIVVPASAASANPSIQQQIDAATAEFDKLVDQYDGVNQKLQDNKAAEAKLQKQVGPSLLAAQTAQAKVGQIAAQAYMAGPVSTLATLMESDNTSQMLDAMGALNEVAASQKKQIAGLQQAISTYNTQKAKLDTLISTETAQQKSLAAQKVTIKSKITKLYALRKKATGSSTVKSSGGGGPAPYYAGRGGKVVKFAYAQIGKPYVWAADGPGSYDCSGLVLAAYRSVGVTLYHQTSVQWKEVHHISRSELKPGDIVFYDSSSIHHVAIYVGSGKVVHAPSPGDHVKISSVSMESVWGYGRP